MSASKLLATNDTVFMEVACLVGPGHGKAEFATGCMSGSRNKPICLGCCKFVVGKYHCRLCKWPMCETACMKEPCHQDFECPVLTRRRIRYKEDKSVYDYIALLRGVLLSQQQPELFAKIKKTVDKRAAEVEDRKGLEEMTEFALKFERKFWLTTGSVDPKELAGIRRMFRVDGIKYIDTTRSCIAIYPKMLKVATSCVPTTRFNHYPPGDGLEGFTIELYALKEISNKGKIVRTLDEDLLLLGTCRRRKALKRVFDYNCKCVRCCDPLELGTYFSAMSCPKKPCEGYLLPVHPLEIEAESEWACSKCGFFSSQRDILDFLDLYTIEILRKARVNSKERLVRQDLDIITDSCMNILKKCMDEVHQNHYSLWPFRNSMIRMLSKALPDLPFANEELPPDALTKEECAVKIFEQAQIVISVLHKLIPGYCPIKGRTLYHMAKALRVTFSASPELLFKGSSTKKSMDMLLNSALLSFEKIKHLPPQMGYDDHAILIKDLEQWRDEMEALVLVNEELMTQEPGSSTRLTEHQAGIRKNQNCPPGNSASGSDQPECNASGSDQPESSAIGCEQIERSASGSDQPCCSKNAYNQPGCSKNAYNQPGGSATAYDQPGCSKNACDQPGSTATGHDQPGSSASRKYQHGTNASANAQAESGASGDGHSGSSAAQYVEPKNGNGDEHSGTSSMGGAKTEETAPGNQENANFATADKPAFTETGGDANGSTQLGPSSIRNLEAEGLAGSREAATDVETALE